MKERGILFSGSMIRAILDNRKTQTRRVGKLVGNDGPQLDYSAWRYLRISWVEALWQHRQDIRRVIKQHCPYGVPGDRMVVREAYWAWGKWVPNGATAAGRKKFKFMPVGTSLRYQENPPKQTVKRDGECGWVYRHARYMPKAHSRITLELTDVRVQRVQEISEEDAKAEGVWRETFKPSYKVAFAVLWDSINAKRGFGWVENVWVWALTFRRLP